MTRSLSAELRERSDDDLAVLLATRPDLATPVPGDLAVLAARAGVRVSVLRALEQLDAPTLRLLDGLLLLPAPTSLEALAALAPGLPRARVRTAVDRLRALALVWGDDDGLQLVRTVAEAVGEHPAGLGRPVSVLLARADTARLDQLLRDRGEPPSSGPALPARRAAALAAVLDGYDGEHLTPVLAGLPVEERDLLATVDRGGALGTSSAASTPTPLTKAMTPVQRLLARGLLVAVDAATVELPREVGLALRADAPLGEVAAEPPPLSGRDVGARTADEAGGGQASSAVRLVEQLLDSYSATPPAVLRAGGLGVRDLRVAARELDETEAVVALLLEVAWAAGLLERTPGDDPQWQPTPAYDSWLAREPGTRWAALAAAWLSTPRAPGLVGERDDKDRALAALGPDLVRPGLAAVRHDVLGLLAAAGAGVAAPAAALLARASWLAPRRAGRSRDRATGWALEEAAVLGITGRGALTTAGRRLLEGDLAGAAAAAAKHLPEPVATLLLQADLTAVAAGPLQPEVGRELRLLADAESAGAGSVHRFSEASVRRALDAGRSAADVQAFLARVSSTGIPQTLAYLIDDVGRRHGVLRAGSAGSYLRCDDEALLTEALVSRRTSSADLRRLAPSVLVSPLSVARLLEVLRGAGFAPVGEGESGAAVLTRRDEHRTPARPRGVRAELTPLTQEQAARAVRALREGDAASRAGQRTGPSALDGGAATPVRDRSAAATVAVLQQAVHDEARVVLEYVDPGGRTTERVVTPRGLEAGYLTAYDERAGITRSFSVASIAGVSAVA